MVFSSILFLLVFLPIFLLAYQFTPESKKNLLILLVSILFYAWGVAPKFILIVLISLCINYYVVSAIHMKSQYKKQLLLLSITINLGLLAYFKYFNFFIDNVNLALEAFDYKAIYFTKVLLPIGISFFTFQSLTYTIDVYRNKHAPLKKLSDYLLYILMFPQLIAGPIVRFNTIADDIENRHASANYEQRLEGVYRFILGLSKKVIIANVLGAQVELIYQLPTLELTISLAWIAVIAYSFQIYYDFSGYSDMAIGLGKILGFSFPENFNNPYTSKSITEFWRKWHITLGEWMRDYLYIPLGGNRSSSVSRLYMNLCVVFVLSGLWHGASWNFVIWGIWHGLFLILDRLFLLRITNKMGEIPSVAFTYVVVLVGWVFFSIEDLSQAKTHLITMFSISNAPSTIQLGKEFWVTIVIATFFAFLTLTKFGKRWQDYVFFQKRSVKSHFILFSISAILLLLCISYITSSGFNPFIYFRF